MAEIDLMGMVIMIHEACVYKNEGYYFMVKLRALFMHVVEWRLFKI